VYFPDNVRFTIMISALAEVVQFRYCFINSFPPFSTLLRHSTQCGAGGEIGLRFYQGGNNPSTQFNTGSYSQYSVSEKALPLLYVPGCVCRFNDSLLNHNYNQTLSIHIIGTTCWDQPGRGHYRNVWNL
jgi:hypothetical protein